MPELNFDQSPEETGSHDVTLNMGDNIRDNQYEAAAAFGDIRRECLIAGWIQ
jgi:hypothetical protein